jgi:16S rRNA (guanine966-N2)-methyltransferase
MGFFMRVIGGRLGGRDLGTVPKGVRPTSDRVRESLFSILGPLEGKHILDLFAGTGALGLEAYSRGAERIVFVEKSRKTAHALRKRLSDLDLDAAGGPLTLMPMAAEKAVRVLSAQMLEDPPGTPFDLVFMDPPYADEDDRVGALENLLATPLLSATGVVVVEGPKRHPLPPVAGGRILEERSYGDTILTWIARADTTKGDTK